MDSEREPELLLQQQFATVQAVLSNIDTQLADLVAEGRFTNELLACLLEEVRTQGFVP